MILYHGSFLEIAQPNLVHSRPNVDFGRGFYVTPLYEQAAKWCGKFKRRGKDGIISKYEYDESREAELKVLKFDAYSEEWLDFILNCRSGKDMTDYDLVLGGVVRSYDDYDNIKDTFANQKFIKYYMSNIQKKFKEITIEDGTVVNGVIDGKFCSVNVSNRFIKKSDGIIPIIRKYGYNIEVQEKGKEPKMMTIGEFLDDAMKYSLKIKTRFKGLGELSGKQLRETTLDINNRVSVQFTIEDVERELEIMNMIHGPSKKDLEKRKELMKNYKIKRDDLDN